MRSEREALGSALLQAADALSANDGATVLVTTRRALIRAAEELKQESTSNSALLAIRRALLSVAGEINRLAQEEKKGRSTNIS